MWRAVARSPACQSQFRGAPDPAAVPLNPQASITDSTSSLPPIALTKDECPRAPPRHRLRRPQCAADRPRLRLSSLLRPAQEQTRGLGESERLDRLPEALPAGLLQQPHLHPAESHGAVVIGPAPDDSDKAATLGGGAGPGGGCRGPPSLGPLGPT
ncbi:hypothetical protein NDU88_006390 [Pleurodeles waltl]|uniref:Uncharacterized protein n=1 Tax=Pleurodeles waltl TaxID=8319 RepID=A0AAV7TWP7_PLEWA|nr:hypothetical protein NDU88_006390 [Pleurodeles waltl]